MLTIDIENKKGFMNSLLKSDDFDNLLVRNIVIRTYVLFDIDCTLNKEWFDSSNEETTEKYPTWATMRSAAFDIIKGDKLPRTIKIILSLKPSSLHKIHDNAASLFINILFEGDNLVVSTGSSQKTFSLDHEVDTAWDEYILKFLKSKELS